MQLQLYTPHLVALELGVNSHTIRRWCADFAPYLSPTANPAKGSSRRFSAHDVEVLREVQKLRGEGLTTPQINERLSATVNPAEAITIEPVAAQEGPQQAQAALAMVSALESIQTHLEALTPLAARIEAIEQAQQAQRWRVDAAWLVALGFIAGLIVGLAVWWFQ